MHLNGLCLSAFARRHYDARAMDAVQTDALTDGSTEFVLACAPMMRLFGQRQGWPDGRLYERLDIK